MPKLLDLTGCRFGRLVVIQEAGRATNQKVLWLCRCDDGNLITVKSNSLRSGNTHSCGCLKNEGNNLRHGHVRNGDWSRTYNTWHSMMQRCYNKNFKDFKRYGGCDVIVCKRWHKFENFLADMGLRPPGRTLDRYPNPYGNYEPGNCRWATPKEQANNRR